MKKVPVKNAIVFGIIAIIAAVLLWCTSLIGPKEYYPPENDTKLQILVLGDSNMADFGEETIPQMLAEQLPATVYNYGIGGIAAAKVNVQNYFDNSFDLLCLYNITKIMQTKDSQVLYDFYEEVPYREREAIEYSDVLMQMDYAELDYVLIAYGLNDYLAGTPAATGELYDEDTYAGALRSSIQRIKELAPNAKIIVASITYCMLFDGAHQKGDGYELNFGGGTIKEYGDAAMMVAGEFENVYFLDNLKLMDMDCNNYEVYLKDGMHLNVHGQQKYTDNLIQLITEIESKE